MQAVPNSVLLITDPSTTPAENTTAGAAGTEMRPTCLVWIMCRPDLLHVQGQLTINQLSLTASPCQSPCLCSAPVRQQGDLDAAVQAALKHVVRGAHARVVCKSDAVREHACHVRRARLRPESCSRLGLHGGGGAGEARWGVGGHRRG